ncbi:hypothetical protein RND81_02G050000 [Saponaria officinalis]|uniref:Uncharacterized protein n=1 Tax=Saponaria officinalis TaxID=3572 RepID=A0AAW1MR53_SAPOF
MMREDEVTCLVRNQVKFGILVAPLFCFDKVVHHRPNVVAKQFKVFDEFVVDSLDHTFHEIKYKHNRGPACIDFMNYYKKELGMWKDKKLAEDHMIPRNTDQGSTSTNQGSTANTGYHQHILFIKWRI